MSLSTIEHGIIQPADTHEVSGNVRTRVMSDRERHCVRASLLPADPHCYHYTGSLTTPPCSEDVIRSVMALPIVISTERVQASHALYPTDARPVQPLIDRAISGGV